MTPCPSDETLGALVHRALGDDEAAAVTSHLDDCDACREIVIEAVRCGVVGAAPTFARGTPSLPTTDAVPTPTVGERLGRYELRGVLGTGGMGRVYDAYDGELDRHLALKVIRPELTRAGGVLAERLLRESRIMAKVAHPSVITVYDVGRVGDSVFIAMERIRGDTLGAYVARVKPSWQTTLELFERAGAGLAAAHDAGIVHRDFKPDNVLVEADGDRAHRVVVTDFGVAIADTGLAAGSAVTEAESSSSEHRSTRGASDPKLTTTGAAIGTPAYMAPEQLDGERVDARADVFAFAVSTWEALFGERPFPGRTIAEIRVATMTPPRPPRSNVPSRIVRALERGLAIDPDLRWPDMPSLLRALRRPRTARWFGVAAAAVVLVGVGIVGSRALASAPVDPCMVSEEAFDRVIAEPRLSTLRAQLGPKVMVTVDRAITSWRASHAATCSEDAPQLPVVTACLDARRQELAGFLDDVVADGTGHAGQLVAILDDPKQCVKPSPGNLASKVPADPELRRKVTQIRYRAFDAEAARDRAEFAKALAGAREVVDAAKDVWPPLHAETLYLLGSSQSMGGDNKQAFATLREAAAVAERSHHDYIAANAWIQLVLGSLNDEGSPQHALEYVTYAEAAAERIGRPPQTMVLLNYAKGMSLVIADRPKEGEVALRDALSLAETYNPEYLSTVIQGLGYLYEAQARYPDAIAAYRRAIARLVEDHATGTPVESTFRSQLALNLSQAGYDVEAEIESRKAVAINDRVLSDENIDRATAHAQLAQVLEGTNKLDEARAEIEIATKAIAKVTGDRNERYAEALEIEASIYSDLGRNREAVTKYERACDIIAFATGDQSSPEAECWTNLAVPLDALGDHTAALALAEKSIPIMEKSYGVDHPHVAMAYAERGQYRGELGDHVHAIADLSRALDAMARSTSDPGHVAEITYHLGMEIWTQDHARGRAIVELSAAWYATSTGGWRKKIPEIKAWLAAHH